MLIWVLLIASAMAAINVAYAMGATTLGYLLFGGGTFLILGLLSFIFVGFLSLLLGKNVQEVPGKISKYDILSFDGTYYDCGRNGKFHKDYVDIIVHQTFAAPVVKIVEYKMGGWKGYWLWDLYTRNKETIVYLDE